MTARGQGDILRGHKTSIGARLEADLAAMQAPAAPFEACDAQRPSHINIRGPVSRQ